MDEVEIIVGDEFVGAVLSDLASRRARVRGTEAGGSDGLTKVLAEIPALELVRYTTTLRSLGHGSGSFTRAPLRYAAVPVHVQDRLTGAATSGSD